MPEDPPAQRRLAAAFGVPVLVQSEPEPPPGAARLNRAAGAARLRPWLTVGVVLLVLAMVAVVSALRSRPEPIGTGEVVVTDPISSAVAVASATAGGADAGVGVVVHVAGSVAAPGIVTLPAGSRVAEAVAAAGGALPGTSLDGLNLARRLTDGEQVVVGAVVEPTGGSAPAAGSSPATASAADQVDLNAATSEELQELPRVGPATAEKIIEYRERNGRFSTVDQLLEVPGIGERTLEGMRDKVRV